MTTVKNAAMWGSFAHRLGTVMRTRQAADYIGLFEGSGGFEPYVQENSYDKGDVVIKDNRLFEANEAIAANTPFLIGTTGATWEEISPAVGNAVILPHNPSGLYEQGEVCVRNGYLVVANKRILSGGLDTDWDGLKVRESDISFFKPWAPNTLYKQWQMVIHEDSIYHVLTNHTSTTSIDTVRMKKLTNISLPVTMYVSTAKYSKDAIVIRNLKFYAANNDIPAGTPFVVGTTGTTWQSSIPRR